MTANFITLKFNNSVPGPNGQFTLGNDGVYTISAFGAFNFSGGTFSLSSLSLNTVQFSFVPVVTDTFSGQLKVAIYAATQDPSITMNGFSDDSVTVIWPLAKGGTNQQDMSQGNPVTLTGFFAAASPPPPPPPPPPPSVSR